MKNNFLCEVYSALCCCYCDNTFSCSHNNKRKMRGVARNQKPKMNVKPGGVRKLQCQLCFDHFDSKAYVLFFLFLWNKRFGTRGPKSLFSPLGDFAAIFTVLFEWSKKKKIQLENAASKERSFVVKYRSLFTNLLSNFRRSIGDHLSKLHDLDAGTLKKVLDELGPEDPEEGSTQNDAKDPEWKVSQKQQKKSGSQKRPYACQLCSARFTLKRLVPPSEVSVQQWTLLIQERSSKPLDRKSVTLFLPAKSVPFVLREAERRAAEKVISASHLWTPSQYVSQRTTRSPPSPDHTHTGPLSLAGWASWGNLAPPSTYTHCHWQRCELITWPCGLYSGEANLFHSQAADWLNTAYVSPVACSTKSKWSVGCKINPSSVSVL